MTNQNFVNQKLKFVEEIVLHTDAHIFLTGKAGTGKTTFLRSLPMKTAKRMAVVAPTGVAAINAGGQTIHSFFQLPFGPQIPEDARPSVGRDEWKSQTLASQFQKIRKPKLQLMRALDLLGARVAAAQQRVLRVLGGAGRLRVDDKGGARERFRRERTLQQARDRGRAHGNAPRLQGVERLDPALLRLAGHGLGRDEAEIAQAEHGAGLAQHRGQIPPHALGGGVVRADHEQRPAGKIAQRGAEVGAVHRRKPGNERRKPAALQQTWEGGSFPVIKKDVVENFHTGPIIAQARRGGKGVLGGRG